MWTKFTRKYSAAIRSDERGQVVVEYILILVAVISIFVAILRPEVKNLQNKLTSQFSKGFFQVDETGEGYYHFRVH